MKIPSTIVLASVAVMGSAQFTVNSNGTYSCTLPNAAYCSSFSGNSNIIIRCSDGVGQPGNCDDNLAGEPPLGDSFSPCWESSPTAGDAACSKNDLVYPGSGVGWNTTVPFAIPGSAASSSSLNVTATSGYTTITTTSTSTRYNTVHTTITTLVSASDGLSESTYTDPATTESESSTAAAVSASTTSAFTTYSTIVSGGPGTVFTTVLTTLNTTICPESSATISTSSASSSPSLTSASTASAITPAGPIFSIPLNSTTINGGPGPASVGSTSLVAPYGTSASVTYSSVAGGVNSTTPLAYAPTTLQTTFPGYSSLVSSGFPQSIGDATFMSPTSTGMAAPVFTGAAMKKEKANAVAMAAVGLFAAALI